MLKEGLAKGLIQSNRTAIIAAVVLLLISFIVLVTTPFNSINSPSSIAPIATVTKSTCDRPAGFILIVTNLSGFNDSISHGSPFHPWPIIQVQRGQTVRFIVCNHDTTQSHGFAVTHYLDAGIAIAPGEAYLVIFTAIEPGTFDIFCNIFCTIHVFMRGQLIVAG